MGTQNRVTRGSHPSANSSCPLHRHTETTGAYADKLMVPVCGARGPHKRHGSPTPPCPTHPGLAEVGRGSDAGEVDLGTEAAEQRRGTLCPFEWTKCAGLKGETLEPQSSQTIVHRDWVKEGKPAALPCPGYCARDPALRPLAPPQSSTTKCGLSPGPLREEDRGWLLSDLVARSHFVG